MGTMQSCETQEGFTVSPQIIKEPPLAGAAEAHKDTPNHWAITTGVGNKTPPTGSVPNSV